MRNRFYFELHTDPLRHTSLRNPGSSWREGREGGKRGEKDRAGEERKKRRKGKGPSSSPYSFHSLPTFPPLF